jgi:hypothetical protein
MSMFHVWHVGWNASSPDALHVALGQGITDRVDCIESEIAVTVFVDATQVIFVQAAEHIIKVRKL